MDDKNKCLCDDIKDLSYLYTHEDEEMIFKYFVNNQDQYKYYKDRRYVTIGKCPKCGKALG